MKAHDDDDNYDDGDDDDDNDICIVFPNLYIHHLNTA